MVTIFVALVDDSISFQSSPIEDVHVALGFKFVLLCEDMLNSTDDGLIRHWVQKWYHPHAHSHKKGHMNHVRPQRSCCGE